MCKSLIKITLTIFLSILLINSNSFAFHKNGTSSKSMDKIEGDKTKDYKVKYCTSSVKEKEKTDKKHYEDSYSSFKANSVRQNRLSNSFI